MANYTKRFLLIPSFFLILGPAQNFLHGEAVVIPRGGTKHVDSLGDPLPPQASARLGTLRLRHQGRVNSVCFSPDSLTLASGSHDGTVRLWDVKTGKELLCLEPKIGSIFSVAFSPDGKIIAAGGEGNQTDKGLLRTIILWDRKTGKEKRVLEGHEDWVYSIAFSPDGTKLVSGSKDKTIRVWLVKNGLNMLTFKGHESSVRFVCFSPKGLLVASGSGGEGMLPGDTSVRLWSLLTKKEKCRLNGHHFQVLSGTFSKDGKTLATGSLRSCKIWDIEKEMEVNQFLTDPYALHFLQKLKGNKIAVGGSIGTVEIWDYKGGRKLLEMKGHGLGINCMDISTDESLLASGSDDKTVRIWDLKKGIEVFHFPGHQYEITSLAFSKDGKMLGSKGGDNRLIIWDVSRGNEKARLSNEGRNHYIQEYPVYPVQGINFLGKDKILGGFSKLKPIYLWKIKSHERLVGFSSNKKSPINCFGLSEKEGTLALGEFSGAITLWDIINKEKIGVLIDNQRPSFRDFILSISFSPEGSLMASCNDKGEIRIWDLKTKEIISYWEAGSLTSCVKFSKDGKCLASNESTHGGKIRIWTKTGKLLKTLEGHLRGVSSLDFSPVNKDLASGGLKDGKVVIWDLGSGKKRKELNGHMEGVNCVAYSGNGKLLASGSSDSTILLWPLKD